MKFPTLLSFWTGTRWFSAYAASVEQAVLLQHDNGRTVSPALFLDLEEAARLADITYCIGTAGLGVAKPFQCLSRCSDFPAFELLTTWNTGPWLDDSCGYIALDHAKGRIIVAIRGTYSISSALVDLATIPQEYTPYPGGNPNEPVCHNCSVHSGFQRSWKNTRDIVMNKVEEQSAVHPQYDLHVIGHSLGGVVAGFAGLDMLAHGWNPTVTTFGEPRGGNQEFVQWFNERYDLLNTTRDRDELNYRRVTHIDDPVPQVPPTEFGFLMHAGEIFISKDSLSPDLVDLEHCTGSADKLCIAGQDTTVKDDMLDDMISDRFEATTGSPFQIPARWKLWQMLFAHRDYFWRLGMCVPPAGSVNDDITKYDL
ncbi:hypothetical protein LTR86_005162 [Recurvomyces mirabilis]|nr:hypothetical protein LTR86_005162 [Recurvomyces mirabilis]